MIEDYSRDEEKELFGGKDPVDRLEGLLGDPNAQTQEQKDLELKNLSSSITQTALGHSAIHQTRELYQDERQKEIYGAEQYRQYAEMLQKYNGTQVDQSTWTAIHTYLSDKGNGTEWITTAQNVPAWEAAGDMMADEQTTLVGFDQQATKTAMYMSGASSLAARAFGFDENTEWLEQQAVARGLSLGERGRLYETLAGVFKGKVIGNHIFQESYGVELAAYKDPAWNKEAKDAVWAAWQSNEISTDMANAIGLTKREHLDRFNSREALTYSANRTLAEQRFGAYAANDETGAVLTMLGRMGPSLLNDPDMVGELLIASAATVLSGGAAGAGYVALKVAGMSAKGAKWAARANRATQVIRQASKISRLTPSRVTGDLIIPMSRAWKGGKGLSSNVNRLKYSWRNMEKFDNWTTFAMGAAGDGAVGGASQYLLSMGTYDALNELHYGKGQVPSGFQMGTFMERTGMGIFGGLAFGSALRMTMNGVTKGSLSLIEGNKTFQRVMAGLQSATGDATAATSLIGKTFDMKSDDGSLTGSGGVDAAAAAARIASRVVSRAEATGSSPTRVAVRVREEIKGMFINLDNPEAEARLDAVVTSAVTAEANTPGARMARYELKAETEQARLAGETGSRRQQRLRNSVENARRLNTAVLVKAANDGIDPNNPKEVADWVETEGGRISKEEAEAIATAESRVQEAEEEFADAAAQAKHDSRAVKRAQTAAEAPKAPEGATSRPEAETPERAPEGPSRLEDTPEYKAGAEARQEAEADIEALRAERAEAEGTAPQGPEPASRVAELNSKEYTVQRLKAMLKALGGKPGKMKKAQLAAKVAQLEAEAGKQMEIEWDAGKQSRASLNDKKQAGKDLGQRRAELLERKLQIAERHAVDPETLDGLIVLNMARRQAKASADNANKIVDMYAEVDKPMTRAEAFAYLRNMTGDVPSEEVMLVLMTGDITGRGVNITDPDNIPLDNMRRAIKAAEAEIRADLGSRSMDDPQLGMAYSLYIRKGWSAFAKSLQAVEDDLHRSLASAKERMVLARKNRHAMSDEDLNIFLGRSPEAVDGKEYAEDALSRATQMKQDIGAADVELRPDSPDEPVVIQISNEIDAAQLTNDAMKAELMRDFGYNDYPLKAKGVDKKMLKRLLVAHRYLAEVDAAYEAGRLKEGESATRFREVTHADTQREMLSSILGKIQNEIEVLKRAGHGGDLKISEVDMLALMPEGYSGLRDGLFGSARLFGADKKQFDLIKVQEIAALRLAAVDEAFRTRQIAAAQKKLAQLEQEPGTDAAIAARQYQSRIKALNERSLVSEEIIPGVQAAHAILRDSMDSADLAEHITTQRAAIREGIKEALYTRDRVSGTKRLEMLREYKIRIENKNAHDGNWEATKEAQIDTILAVMNKELKERYGWSVYDLVDGSEGMYDGKLVGLALVEMMVGRRYSGDSATNRFAKYKPSKGGNERVVLQTGDVRDNNPLGNMSVRKFVDDLNKIHEHAVDQHILFDKDGNLRRLEDVELDDIINYYESLKDLSDEEFEARLQDHTYEVRPRTKALVTRTVPDSPLKDFRSIGEMVEETTDRLYYQAPGYTQHVHDDVIVLQDPGTITALWGGIGEQFADLASPKGPIAGASGGWKALAVTPGSLADFINVRQEALYGAFEGMAELARYMGIANLMDLKHDLMATLAKQNGTELDTLDDMNRTQLREFAKENGLAAKGNKTDDLRAKIKEEMGEQARPENSLTKEELNIIAEARTLAELEQALVLMRIWADEKRVHEVEFTVDEGAQFRDPANNWDASSQAVNLAKAMMTAYNFDKQTGGDATRVVDAIYRILGVDREEGLIPDQLREAIFVEEMRVADYGTPVDDEGVPTLVEKKADFYAEVFDKYFQDKASWKTPQGFAGTKNAGSPIEGDEVFAKRAAIGWIGVAKAAGPMKPTDGAKKSDIADYIRNNLMKKPVMTRGYGAGVDAYAGSSGQFLKNAIAESLQKPGGVADRMLDGMGPELKTELLQAYSAGNFGNKGIIYKMAWVLASAFADESKKGTTGQMLTKGLGLPNSGEFRDSMRRRGGSKRYTITRERAEIGKPRGETRESTDALFVEDLTNPKYADQVNDVAMREADRRGFDELSDDLRIGLGRWFLRNELHVNNGVVTAEQMARTESRMLTDLSKIFNDPELTPAEKDVQISTYLDNWGTKQSSETVQAMSRSFFGVKKDVVDEHLGAAAIRPEHLSPIARAQVHHGMLVHSTSASSAGRTWTSLGMAAKRGASRAEVVGEEFEETRMITEARLADPAVEYGKMEPTERRRFMKQLAVQDMMRQLGGVVKPPEIQGEAYRAPKTSDEVTRWADMDAGDGQDVRRRKLELAQRIKDAEKDPDEDLSLEKIIESSFIDDTHPLLKRSFWGDEDADGHRSSSDLGVPHLLVAALDKHKDIQLRERVGQVARGEISGPGIKASELVAPAPVKSPENIQLDESVTYPRPDTDFGRYNLEDDADSMELAVIRELVEFARKNNISMDMKEWKIEAFVGLMTERALVGAAQRLDMVASNLLKVDPETNAPKLDTVEGVRELNAEFEVAMQSLLKDAYGDMIGGDGKPKVVSLGRIESEPTVYPARNQLEAMQMLARSGSTENLDTLLGPAPFANMVLKGSATVPDSALVGLMPKTVFGTDFSLLGGAIEQNLRFAQWFLMRKTGLTAEEVSADFIALWKNRMDADEEGLMKYEAEFKEWQKSGYDEIEGMARVDPTADWASMSAYKSYLKNNSGDAALIKRMTGHDIANMSIKEIREQLFTLDSAKGIPDTFLDGLGRDLMADNVAPGTLVWRTHSQLRKAAIDPKSQPMMHRMWMAYILQRSVGDNLNIRENFGEVRTSQGSAMFSHRPDTPDRIKKTRKMYHKILFGDKDITSAVSEGDIDFRSHYKALGRNAARILEQAYPGAKISERVAFIYKLAVSGLSGKQLTKENVRAKFVALAQGEEVSKFSIGAGVDNAGYLIRAFDDMMEIEAKAELGAIRELLGEAPGVDVSARLQGESRVGAVADALEGTRVNDAGRAVANDEVRGDELGEAVAGPKMEEETPIVDYDEYGNPIFRAEAEAEKPKTSSEDPPVGDKPLDPVTEDPGLKHLVANQIKSINKMIEGTYDGPTDYSGYARLKYVADLAKARGKSSITENEFRGAIDFHNRKVGQAPAEKPRIDQAIKQVAPVTRQNLMKLRDEVNLATRNRGEGMTDSEYQSLLWRYLSDLERFARVTEGLENYTKPGLLKLDAELKRISELFGSDFKYGPVGLQLQKFSDDITEVGGFKPSKDNLRHSPETAARYDAQVADNAAAVGDHDPMFGNGRTLWNETDEPILKKRYPSIHSLVTELNKLNVFKDADEARKFAIMAMMNADVLEGILPGIKIEYTGEAGFARAINTKDAANNIRSTIEVLENMRGMDAVGAFDVIAHEIGHYAIARALTTKNALANELKSMVGEARNRLRTKEGRKLYQDAFVAIHGHERGMKMFENLMEFVVHQGRAREEKMASAFELGVQEMLAQMYAWRLLSKVGDEVDVTVPFHRHLGLVNEIAGTHIRKLSSAFDRRVVGGRRMPFFADGDKVRGALDRVITMTSMRNDGLFKTDDPRIPIGIYQNSPANTASIEGYKTELNELRKLLADEVDPDARQHLMHQIRIREMRLAEQDFREQHRPRPEQVAAVIHSADPSFTERSLMMSDSFLEGESYITGLPRHHGLIHMDKMPSWAKSGITRSLLAQHFTGRSENLFHGHGFRSGVDTVSEVIAMQGISSPWKVEDDAVNAMAAIMSPFVGNQSRTGANAIEQAVSLQNINTSWQANWGPTLSAGIELNHLIRKQPELGPRVDAAFRELFKLTDAKAREDVLQKLAASGGRAGEAAMLLEEAVTGFKINYDRTLDMAEAAGMIDSDVRNIMRENPELPLSLSKEAKNTNNRITAAKKLAGQMQNQLIERATNPSDTHYGYVDGDFVYLAGLVGDYKNTRGGDLEASFAKEVEANPAMVKSVQEYGATMYTKVDDDMTSEAELFYKYSTLIHQDIQRGEIRFDDLPEYMRDRYLDHLTNDTVEPGANQRGLQSLGESTNEVDMDIRDLYENNYRGAYVSPLEIRAAQLYQKLNYGGYVHADSRLISTSAIRESLGLDAWNDNPMEVMMQMAKGIGFEALERSISQHHFGIKGFGMMQALDQIDMDLKTGNTLFGGDARHPDPTSIEGHRAAIKELRNQYRMAAMRAPISEDGARSAAEQGLSKLAPYLAIPVQMVTSPNWSIASLAVEGMGGIIRGMMQAATGQTKNVAGNWSKVGKSAMRDDLHNVGLALPYHLTTMGFGYQWVLDPSGKALEDIDPTAAMSAAERVTGGLRKISNFAFEWSQLKTRSMRLLPAQQKMMPFLMSRHGEESKVIKAARAIGEATAAEPDRMFSSKDIYVIAREHGINDPEVVKELWDMGAFEEGVARTLTDVADAHLTDATPIQWQRIQDWIHRPELSMRGRKWSGNTDGKLEAKSAEVAHRQKAAQILQQMLFREINKTNLEPQVGTTIVTDTGFKRLWSQLSQYSIMFMKQAMGLSTVGAASLITWLVPLLMGETVYQLANQAKNGKRPDIAVQEMLADPLGAFLQIASRVPFFGAGTFASQYLIDNSLAVAGGMLPEGAPLSSYKDKRTGAISSPGMPAPQMMMQAIQGMADAVRHTVNLATSNSSSQTDEATAGLTDTLTRFGPVDLRQVWAPVFRTITGQWDTVKNTPSKHRDVVGTFLEETGIIEPLDSSGRDARQRNANNAAATKAMENARIRMEDPKASGPSGTPGSSQGQPTGSSEQATKGLAPKSASYKLADKL